jgi:hypothetical protein
MTAFDGEPLRRIQLQDRERFPARKEAQPPRRAEQSGVEGWLKRSAVLFITVPERCQLALGIS